MWAGPSKRLANNDLRRKAGNCRRYRTLRNLGSNFDVQRPSCLPARLLTGPAAQRGGRGRQYFTVMPKSRACALSELVTEEPGTGIGGVAVGAFGGSVMGPLISESGVYE